MNSSNRARKIKQIIRTVLLAVAGIFLGYSVYLMNAYKLVGNQLPMPFGYGSAVVLSGSMEPSISVNDLVIVREGGAYNPGDVIVFEDDGMLITHRVIAHEGTTVVTQGDANNSADAPISEVQIKGTVIAVVPGLGVLVQFMKQPVGIIAVLAAVILLTEMSYRKEKEQDSEELEKIREEIRKLKEEQ